MKRMYLGKITALLLAGMMTMTSLTACGGGASTGEDKDTQTTDTQTTESAAETETAKEPEKEAEPAQTATKVEGTLTAAGSSALLPLVQSAAEAFMVANPDAAITVNGGGSGEGLKQVADGAVDIGNSDVTAEEKLDPEIAKTLVDHKVCTITMAPVVNKDLGVTELTTDQLVGIFTSKITNWKEVGGPDEAIMLVTRPSSSGTRALFKEWAINGEEESSNEALETDDSGTLLQTVQQNKGAIGYVALSYLVNNEDVATVSIDGVEPSLENTYNGTYKVWGFEHMYTKGEPGEVAKAFLEYMQGDDFAEDLEAMGYGVSSKMSEEAVASHEK